MALTMVTVVQYYCIAIDGRHEMVYIDLNARYRDMRIVY